MRKAQDDAVARSVAEHEIGNLIEGASSFAGAAEEAFDIARQVLSTFKAVEFETAEKKIGDETIHLRQLVITGPWVVDPTSK